MQLKYNNYVRNRIVYMELETTNFTKNENAALEKFGEPVIKIQKLYDGHPVNIERRIKTGFKVRVKFDGTEDIKVAISAANDFFEDLQEILRDAMDQLMNEKFVDFDHQLVAQTGLATIEY